VQVWEVEKGISLSIGRGADGWENMGNAGVCTRRTLIKQARVCDQAMPGLRLACDHLAGLWERHISRETCLKGSLAYQVVQQQGEAEMGGFVHGGRGPRRWQRSVSFSTDGGRWIRAVDMDDGWTLGEVREWDLLSGGMHYDG
jgi:hypothetical protein